MRLLAFGDLHSHNFKDFSKADDITGNTRLTYILSTLDTMYQTCKANDIHTILFAGDLFHSRKQVETNVLNHVFRKITLMAMNGIEIYMLVGNHDQIDNSRFPEHSLEIFKGVPNITVLDRFTPLYADGILLFPLPFTKDIEYSKDVLKEYKSIAKAEKDCKSIILGHCGISGAKVGTNNHIMQDAFTLEDLGADVFNYGIFGHYHKPQFLTNTFAYTGSPLQHNFGDSGNDCGFIYLDTDIDKMYHVPITTTPKFVTVTNQEDIEKHLNDYVCIQIKHEQIEQTQEQIENLDLNYKIDIIKEFKNESRIDVNTSMNEKEIIEKYCKEKDREDAVKTLLGIIGEVL